ncbi:MAG: LPS export ABC transporter protein LptC, partial [Granulosicoccus sp.]
MVLPKLGIKLCKAKRFLPLCLLAFLSGCVNDMKEVAAILEPMTLPVVEEVNAQLIYTDSARVKVLVDAPQLHHYTGEDPYLELPKGVHITFFNLSGEIESEITANYAISFEKKDVMVARNDVVVINSKGERLNTEELSWSKKHHRIFTDEFVTITTEDEVIYGHG